MSKNLTLKNESTAFWLKYPDPTQASVHLALQWLAYVYTTSRPNIDEIIKFAQPYSYHLIASKWEKYLINNGINEHVNALTWLQQNFSTEQAPFLIETCWRLLLMNHEFENHAPLGLGILSRLLNISDDLVMEIGDNINKEYADSAVKRIALRPINSRYLDRVEWQLTGHQSNLSQRQHAVTVSSNTLKFTSFFALGFSAGIALVSFLVFGPLQLGRIKIEPYSHYQQANSSHVSNHSNTITTEERSLAKSLTTPTEALLPDQYQNIQIPLKTDTLEATPVSNAKTPQADTTPQTDTTLNPLTDMANNEASVASTQTDVTDPQERLMEVTASILNIRSEASLNSKVILKLAAGDKIWSFPQETQGSWILVRAQDTLGYASLDFLQPSDQAQ